MKRVAVITVLLGMSLVFLSAGPGLAASETFMPIQLSANAHEYFPPEVSGDRIVWYGTGGTDGGTDYEVFTWTPAGGTSQVTLNSTDDITAVVSGDRIAWVGRPGGVNNTDIYTWTPAGDTLHLMSTYPPGFNYNLYPQVSGDRVVWWHITGEVYTWTPATGVILLTDGVQLFRTDLQVSGDRIVWSGTGGTDAGADYEVFTLTPGGGIVQLTANDTDDSYPRVSGDRVVWTGKGGTDGGLDREVFTWTPSGGTVQLTTTARRNSPWEDAWISGDRIAWVGQSGSDLGADREVFTWTPATGVVQVTEDTTQAWDPRVSGERIVWTGTGGTDGGADREVFTWTSARGTSQVTLNSTDDLWAVVSGDRLAWLVDDDSDGGADREIFTAIFTAVAVPAPAGPAFPDVPTAHPYYTAISGMASRGIIGGYANGTFGPEDLVMRQQFAKMIVGTLGLDVVEEDWQDASKPFRDLGPDDLDKLYPHEYVAVCARSNITKGTKDPTLFAPYDNITRAQVITMVARAADNLKGGTLQSVPAGWTGFLPAGDPTHGSNIAKAEYNGLLAGILGPSGTVADWDTFAKATRGEVAQILWNLLALMD